MKKLLTTLIVSSVVLFSCKSEVVPLSDYQRAEDSSQLPSWVLEPSVAKGIGGVGIASSGREDIKFRLPKAEKDAKANIVALISSDILRFAKKALAEAGIGDNGKVVQAFDQATREAIGEMPVEKIKRTNIYQALDGALYVRMVLGEEDYNKYLRAIRRSYRSKLKEVSLSSRSLDKAEEAVRILFEALEKEVESNY